MSEIETITMTMREVDRLKVVEAVVDGRLMTCVPPRGWA